MGRRISGKGRAKQQSQYQVPLLEKIKIFDEDDEERENRLRFSEGLSNTTARMPVRFSYLVQLDNGGLDVDEHKMVLPTVRQEIGNRFGASQILALSSTDYRLPHSEQYLKRITQAFALVDLSALSKITLRYCEDESRFETLLRHLPPSCEELVVTGLEVLDINIDGPQIQSNLRYIILDFVWGIEITGGGTRLKSNDGSNTRVSNTEPILPKLLSLEIITARPEDMAYHSWDPPISRIAAGAFALGGEDCQYSYQTCSDAIREPEGGDISDIFDGEIRWLIESRQRSRAIQPGWSRVEKVGLVDE